MGKMVLFLADGTTLDIPLDKARVTVGRRSSNDVCLPYAPVSGEHALFVVVPTGVVVEDLGSTNGTIVNGKRVARQFLHDGDRVEIGRQKFVYLADANATVGEQQPPPAVERRRHSDRPAALGDDGPAVAADTGKRAEPRAHEPAAPADAPAPLNPLADAIVVPPPAALPDAWQSGAEMNVAGANYAAMAASHGITFGAAAGAPLAPSISAAPPQENPEPAPAGPHLMVLEGPNAGRFLALTKDESLFGRVGVHVVSIRRGDRGFRLAQAEGDGTLEVNGVEVPLDGLELAPGDVIAIAGARLELVVPEMVGAG